VSLCFCLASCGKDDVEPEKVRTLMVYLAGDNNLSSYMQGNVDGMLKGWKEAFNGNIVIYLDARGTAPRLLTFEKGEDGAFERREVKVYEEMNSALAETLSAVVEDMQELFPAQSYGLIMGSHATGWFPPGVMGRGNVWCETENPVSRSFGSDEGMEMDVRELAGALPEGLDFILFDACMMSSVEALYELREKVRYVVASAAELPAPGFPYEKVMSCFWGQGDGLVRGLAEACGIFHEYYGNYTNGFGTIALIDMTELDCLGDLTRQVLRGRAEEAGEMTGKEVYYYPKADYEKHYMFFDLGQYVKYMMRKDPALYAAYEGQLNRVVVFKAATRPFYNSEDEIDPAMFSGLSTYIPLKDWPDYTKAYWGFEWAKFVYDKE